MGFNWQYVSIGSDNGLAPSSRQAIIWTNADPVHRCIYAAPEGDELIPIRMWPAYATGIYSIIELTFGFSTGLLLSSMTCLGIYQKAISEEILKTLQIKNMFENGTSITRATRMPAFWGYPMPPHDYSFYWVILDPKSKEDKVKVTNLKNSPK